MAIITKPGTITKGQDNTITLVKADLLANSVVTADAYFSNAANWSKAIITYKTTEGNQRQSLIFDTDLATPTAVFNPSADARDVWEIQSLIIYDNDKGFLQLRRADLTVADFDISFGVVAPSGIPLTWNTGSGPATWTTTSNSYIKTSSDANYAFIQANEEITSGDLVLEFTTTDGTLQQLIGLDTSLYATSDNDYSLIDFGFNIEGVPSGNTRFGITETGNIGKTLTMPYVTGDTFKIEVNSGVVTYYHNNDLVYTSLATLSTYPVRLSATVYGAGTTVYDIKLIGNIE